jgi:hypothetical protein
MKGVADNVAIWPEFVDSCLAIRSVRYIKIEKADEALSSYTLLNLAIARTFKDGNIEWQDASGPEHLRRSHIAYEDGSWVSRDGTGHIYDMH